MAKLSMQIEGLDRLAELVARMEVAARAIAPSEGYIRELKRIAEKMAAEGDLASLGSLNHALTCLKSDLDVMELALRREREV